MQTNGQPASTEVHCPRCGRILKSEKSIKRGAGEICLRKMREAEAAIKLNAKPEQIAKAYEVIELHAFDRTAQGRYDIISGDATELYDTTKDTCTCKAGQYSKLCYHRLVVAMLSA